MKTCLLLIFAFVISSWSNVEEKKLRQQNQKSEFIYRYFNEQYYSKESPCIRKEKKYPWEESFVGKNPRITKEFFRCKGSSLNPVNIVDGDQGSKKYFDCGGISEHGLPLHNGKEHIYPILIDLLNYIQRETRKEVIITCGHCCPKHNNYLDPSFYNSFSKHMIGAEVDFYVQGIEDYENIVSMIMDYYKDYTDVEYRCFRRYDKMDTNVSIPPWYNKEVFIKLFKKHEGRDYDNMHPFPYISVQVRYDPVECKRVNYSWDMAYRNYEKY